MENITGKAVVAKNFLRTRLYLVERFTKWARKHSFIIEAPRRYGKTSVVKEFIRQEKEKPEYQKEFNVFFFELEGTESLNEFCLKLSKELLILYQIRNRIDKLQCFFMDAWNAIAARITKIQLPQFELDLCQRTRNFTFTEWKERITPLVKGLDDLDKITIIVFDELPDMLLNFRRKASDAAGYRADVDSLMGWLRELRQDSADDCKSRFVFCGSVNLRKTLESINLGKRINDMEPFTIPGMTMEESKILIDDLSNQYDLHIEAEAIDFMVSKIADGSPYYGQILVKALIDTSDKLFTLPHVKGIYDGMLRAGNHDLNHFHSRLEDYLTPIEIQCSRTILKHLCYQACHEKDLYDNHIHALCSYEDFQSIVARLIYEGYLAREPKDEAKLAFISPLLKDWWACKVGVR